MEGLGCCFVPENLKLFVRCVVGHCQIEISEYLGMINVLHLASKLRLCIFVNPPYHQISPGWF